VIVLPCGPAQNKFERTILPKIKDQIASLDQQDNPNQAMIELRRELTVRAPPRCTPRLCQTATRSIL